MSYLLDLALQMQHPLPDLNTFGLWKVNILLLLYDADSITKAGSAPPTALKERTERNRMSISFEDKRQSV